MTTTSSPSATSNASPAAGASRIASGPPERGAKPMAVWPRARAASWICAQLSVAGPLPAPGRPNAEARRR